MNKDEQNKLIKKLTWTAVSHGSILVYTAFHTIIGPIWLAIASLVAKSDGDVLSACYYLLWLILLVFTIKDVDKLYSDSHNILCKTIDNSSDA